MYRGIASIGFIILLIGTATASADDYKDGGLTVSHSWARASAGKAKAGAADMGSVAVGAV
ncbi:MAG: hypothetical protein HQ483_00795 [Rhodospirillales bacterium]|nr:hypothetical protein [Rhodospirillales bacterium]